MADLTPAGPAAEPLPTCPFCGGVGIEERVLRGGHQDGEDDAWAYFVVCRSCAAEGPWTKSPGSARRMWSMRHSAPLERRLAALESAARLVLRWASGEPGEAADGALPALRAALGEGEAKR